MEPIDCPYCGGKATFRDTRLIYGRSYGMGYICENYPKCDAYVGAHRKDDKPLGTPANAKLRKWRNKAHATFDPLWSAHKGLRVFSSRQKAYKNLAAYLKIPESKCHIAMFDATQCHKVTIFAKVVRKEVLNGGKDNT